MAMTSLTIILIPAFLVVGYALYRLAVGRPLQRRTVDVLLALLLLGYFAGTAGLGIFWVANRELPVFDLHYLFGYVALTLVIVHVAVNWRVLVAFFRRRAPQPRHDVERTWRPGLRVAGWTVGLVLYGIVCFWLGQRQGTTRIEISMAESPPAPPGSTVGGTEDELPAAAPARHQLVKADGQQRVLADYYHEKTKHSPASLMRDSPGLSAAPQPEVFKEYPDANLIDLPEPHEHAGMCVGAAIEACREPVYGFTPRALSLDELSTLLFMANGVTSTLRYPGRTYYLRAAPSAGALYPTVTYVLARNVEGLPAGLYHYAVREHKLHQLRASEALANQLAALVPQAHFVEQAPVTFVFSSIYYRSSWKYRGRAYRYCCLDAGHLAVQTSLAAAAFGYRCRFIGRFNDQRVNALFELDEPKEGALLIVPVGEPASEARAVVAQRAFLPQVKQLDGPAGALLLLIHGGTSFAATEDFVAPFPPRPPRDKAYADVPVIPLPQEFAEGEDLFPTIRQRRSIRRWAQPGMAVDQLATVLHYAFGAEAAGDGAWSDPRVEDNNALHLYVLVNEVLGLEAGVYYYRRHEHALSQIHTGDYRQQGYEAAIYQDVVGECDALLIMTIDLERFGYPDADRGYRYAAFDAGMLGGRVYLQTTGMGLGCCGIGAFFDNHVSELIDVSPEKELVLYMTAVGVRK
jgi:SagB-type dehydrogenase family enzyme